MRQLEEDHLFRPVLELARLRCSITGEHLDHTQQYAKAICNVLSSQDWWREQFQHGSLCYVWQTACLHDIGKVGIPDYVLKSDHPCSSSEHVIMRQHPELGRLYIEHLKATFPLFIELLEVAEDIALYHHEHYDGTGYPAGLKGDDIPLAARIVAVADVYDAMVSRRSYKNSCSHQDALKYIKESSGTHFDPKIVDAFVSIFCTKFCTSDAKLPRHCSCC